mmetsp:Transcript_9449/g.33456  ORF Transcript_9449/g.33456 Transcript_9449/m.33456 type:complete len:264 (-) Transcript_9449:24-815(-)
MAMQANIGLKPSLARYQARGQHQDHHTSAGAGIGEAENSDDQLLATVEHQAVVASTFLRIGQGHRAITALRRAFKLVEGHSSPPLPINRLANALVRLQLCAVLSQLGRHDQAYSEASQARTEVDSIWGTLTEAAEVVKEADAMGDYSRPAPHLRKMLLRPPSWMCRVVEAGVQTRQAMAVELEFMGDVPSSGGMLMVKGGQDADGDCDASETKSVVLEDRDDLHEEACRLARQLLPEDNEIRMLAEKALLQANTRRMYECLNL